MKYIRFVHLRLGGEPIRSFEKVQQLILLPGLLFLPCNLKSRALLLPLLWARPDGLCAQKADRKRKRSWCPTVWDQHGPQCSEEEGSTPEA